MLIRARREFEMGTVVYGVQGEKVTPKGMHPLMKAVLGFFVVALGLFFLGSFARQYVLVQIVNLEKTAVLSATADGWTEVSSSVVGGVSIVSFALTCTPGPDGDDYTLTGNFLMDHFSSNFRLPRGGFFGCKPNLEDPVVVEQLIQAIFKAMGGESKAEYAQQLFRSVAETIVNILKAKIPFLGF